MEIENIGEGGDARPLTDLTVILDALSPDAWRKVGGRLLVERAIIDCKRLAIPSVKVVVSENTPSLFSQINRLLPEGSFLFLNQFPPGKINQHGWSKISIATPVHENMGCTFPDSLGCISMVKEEKIGKRVLYADTGHLIDPRLLKHLLDAPVPTIFSLKPGENRVRLGVFDREDLGYWETGHIDEIFSRAKVLSVAAIDHYNPEVRGEQEPYFYPVRSKKEALKATWILVSRNQKKVMDLPAQYIDPPFENALTFLLCSTPVTPNQVTIVNLIIAFIVGCLFWSGHFVAGALLTYAAEFLDGVDGKLARVKIIFSRLGEYECYIDFLYEHWWYFALAFGLRHTGAPHWVWKMWLLLAVSDILDNILYTLSEYWYGKSLDLLSSFDSAFRKIAGRRNIYALLFLVGFLMGYPLGTFCVASAWGAITAIIHSVRLVKYRLNNLKSEGLEMRSER